ncbi:GNAT family N-acetyltransferase [Thermococcus sp. ES12]|uniref:GNAT family N-acetyltransferase n=1 Tax=Thermococcus sp. ES12 TaxID=1638246 RepID=UPI001F0EA708|nr:GNAT family N-acetyltransferase [Thermococcus sp. ES12]
MGQVKIRKADLNDVRGIVWVHTGGEDLGGLSIAERYSRGGPWMSVETCAVHINNLLLDDQLVALAELNGTIVGEVEVLFSEERIAGRVRKIGHVDVIEVHPGYRGRGIGRLLLEFVEEIARERKVEMLTVQPDKSAEGILQKTRL